MNDFPKVINEVTSLDMSFLRLLPELPGREAILGGEGYEMCV